MNIGISCPADVLFLVKKGALLAIYPFSSWGGAGGVCRIIEDEKLGERRVDHVGHHNEATKESDW